MLLLIPLFDFVLYPALTKCCNLSPLRVRQPNAQRAHANELIHSRFSLLFLISSENVDWNVLDWFLCRLAFYAAFSFVSSSNGARVRTATAFLAAAAVELAIDQSEANAKIHVAWQLPQVGDARAVRRRLHLIALLASSSFDGVRCAVFFADDGRSADVDHRSRIRLHAESAEFEGVCRVSARARARAPSNKLNGLSGAAQRAVATHGRGRQRDRDRCRERQSAGAILRVSAVRGADADGARLFRVCRASLRMCASRVRRAARLRDALVTPRARQIANPTAPTRAAATRPRSA